MRLKWFGALLALVVLLGMIIGCGGGGGGSSTGVTNVSVFFTDNLNANYDAVWVTVHKVEVSRSDATVVTLFEDAAGLTFNARSLEAGGASLFKFLGGKSVPAGTYVSYRIELDDDVKLYPTGATNGLSRKFANSAAGKFNFLDTFPLAETLTSGTRKNLVFDFDLASWTDDGALIQNPQIRKKDDDDLDNSDRHVQNEFEGTLSNLSGVAPDYTFTLTVQPGLTATIRTDAGTAFRNDSGNPSPTLANGKRVEVRGVFDPSLGAVVARSVKIEDDGDEDEDEAEGMTSDVSASAGTFKLEVSDVEDFIPVSNPILVQTSDSTRFFGRRGQLLAQSEFFNLLGTGGCFVEVEGTYDAGSNTLTATKAKLEDDDDDTGDDDNDYQEVEGASSSLNAAAGTFSVTLSEWEGFAGTSGQVIPVTTTGATRFRSEEGEEITKEQFFTALAGGTRVKVEGVWNGTSMAAKSARIEDNAGGGQDEAKGSITSIDDGAFSFQFRIFEWEGFGGSPNQLLTVATTAGTAFLDDDGDGLTREQFFAALDSGAIVEAKGTLVGSVLTATRLKLDD